MTLLAKVRRATAGLLTLAFALVLPAPAFAQNNPPTPAKPAAKSERVLRAEVKLATLAQPPAAVSVAADGEAAPVVADSAEGRFDQAQKLLRAGLWLKKKGETALAAAAAAKALAQLDAAGAMIDSTAQPALAARRNEIAGLIHERLTGNAALARQNYEAAQQSSPGSTKLAESSLARLDRAEGRSEKPADGESAQDGKPEKPQG